VRLLPGVLGNEESALNDSFQDNLLAPPLYTRPEEFQSMKVPEILLSGNHAKIAEWRFDQSIERTKKIRPDILDPEA
jgi:tRNA (guanine37-N1)-methyltransferase